MAEHSRSKNGVASLAYVAGMTRVRRGSTWRKRRLFCFFTFGGIFAVMTIEDIEKAVAKLPPDQLAQFRAWFDQFDAARFDQKIDRDINEGRLDRLADEAIDDLRNGRTREL